VEAKPVTAWNLDHLFACGPEMILHQHGLCITLTRSEPRQAHLLQHLDAFSGVIPDAFQIKDYSMNVRIVNERLDW